MTQTPLWALVLLALVVAGCDTVLDEDYDLSNPLPPSISFTTASLTSAGFNHDPATPDLGSVRGYAIPAAGDTTSFSLIARLTTQLHHPQTGIGENVTVRYEVTGDAELGVDYQIRHPRRRADGQVIRTGGITGDIVYGVVYQPGQFEMPYLLEVDNEDDPGYFTRFQVRILPSARPGRTLQITMTGASVPSGREIQAGRLPGNRDRTLTIGIGHTLSEVRVNWASGGEPRACPAQVGAGQSVTMTAWSVMAAPAVTYAWNFGGAFEGTTPPIANTATGASVARTFTRPGTYDVTVTATQAASPGVPAGTTASATCQITVTAAS